MTFSFSLALSSWLLKLTIVRLKVLGLIGVSPKLLKAGSVKCILIFASRLDTGFTEPSQHAATCYCFFQPQLRLLKQNKKALPVKSAHGARNLIITC